MSKIDPSTASIRVEILLVFERTAESSELPESWNLLDMFMRNVAGTYEGRFVSPHGRNREPRWSTSQIRNVLSAILENAPIADLRNMRREARAWLRWLTAFEQRAHIERMVEGPMHNYLPVGEREADRYARVEAHS